MTGAASDGDSSGTKSRARRSQSLSCARPCTQLEGTIMRAQRSLSLKVQGHSLADCATRSFTSAFPHCAHGRALLMHWPQLGMERQLTLNLPRVTRITDITLLSAESYKRLYRHGRSGHFALPRRREGWEAAWAWFTRRKAPSLGVPRSSCPKTGRRLAPGARHNGGHAAEARTRTA